MDAKGRVEVGLIKPSKLYYCLLTEIQGGGEGGKYRINKSLPKELVEKLWKKKLKGFQTAFLKTLGTLRYGTAAEREDHFR